MRGRLRTAALSVIAFTASAGTASPPPPRPQAAVPVGPFIVFFERDKADIAPESAAILDNVAAAYPTSHYAQVMLAGHSDRSGSTVHNLKLAQQRVENVKAYLVGRGVPQTALNTVAYGEDKPLVESGDGVRDPQNRNVQIFFGPASGQ